ncbi:hypothetical protein ACFSBJ_17010, partial [Haloplanus ruber]
DGYDFALFVEVDPEPTLNVVAADVVVPLWRVPVLSSVVIVTYLLVRGYQVIAGWESPTNPWEAWELAPRQVTDSRG